jgi:ElaB/YqjD/DUF883 family membrane-anchored ribosome-binding protein
MESPKILPASPNGSGGTWNRTVDKASATAHSSIDKLSSSMRPAVDQFSSSAHQTIDRLADAAAQATASITEKVGQWKELQGQVVADARIRVQEKPVTAIAIAIAAGFVISQLLRSR